MSSAAGVKPEQRFSPSRPCPICGGHDRMQRGEGVRCYGFLSNDGEWAHCTRDEHAGSLERNAGSEAYPHKLTGNCKCGARHGLASGAERNGGRRKGQRGQIVATYDYRDEDGNLLYQTVRFKPKDFHQRRRNGRGRWEWNLQGIRPVLYRLPELIATPHDQLVLVCAGEKDTDRARELGFTATTNPLGEGKWREEYSEHFEGRTAAVIAHNDTPGWKHAEDVVQSLYGKAASVKVVELPDVPEDGGDLGDWTDAGGNAEDLRQLIDETPEWSPPPPPEEAAQREERAEEAWRDDRVRKLARSTDILAEGYELLRRGGLVGEERNAKLMLTVSATRHLRDPMSVIVGGDSSGGKSYLLKQITKTLPEDFYYTLQSVSDKALAYIGEDTLVNRFLQIYELGGMGKEGEQGLEMAKQLLTEGSIERQIAESTGKGVRGRKVKTNGPTGLWTTTTKKTIDAELKNRALGFDIDESPEQTARIIKARPHRKKKRKGADVDYAPFKGLHLWLAAQQNDVVVPFEGVVADLIDHKAVRMRRYADYLMSLVEAHAVLHQVNRERDADSWIVATLPDYRAVYPLVRDLIGEAAEVSVSETMRETVEQAQKIVKMNLPLTRGSLAESLDITPQAAGRRLGDAARSGYVKHDPDSLDRKTRVYVMGDEKLPDKNHFAIPHPDEVAAAFDPPPENAKTRNRGGGVEGDSDGREASEMRNQMRNQPEMRKFRIDDVEDDEMRKADTYAESEIDHKDENTDSMDPAFGGFAFSHFDSPAPEAGEKGCETTPETDAKPGQVSHSGPDMPLSADLEPGSSATLEELKRARGLAVVNVKGRKKGTFSYVGRDEKYVNPYFGNPFEVGKDGISDEVLEMYKPHLAELLATDEGQAEIERLRKDVEAGLPLGCHCAGKDGTPKQLTVEDPLFCHGQLVLMELEEQAGGVGDEDDALHTAHPMHTAGSAGIAGGDQAGHSSEGVKNAVFDDEVEL